MNDILNKPYYQITGIESLKIFGFIFGIIMLATIIFVIINFIFFSIKFLIEKKKGK